MKLNQIFENVSGSVTSAGDVGGHRGFLFAPHKQLIKRNKVGKIAVIRYHHENNWNVR